MMHRMLNALFNLFGYQIVVKNAGILWLSREVIQVASGVEPLIIELDRRTDLSPEYRRHEVYAMGLKRFPEVPAVDVALAIEYSLRRYRGLL